MGYSTQFTGYLKFNRPYEQLTDEQKDRIDLFLEGSCQDCLPQLVNTLCNECLKKIKPIRVPLRLYGVNNTVLGLEWDQHEKAYNVPELLYAFVKMMRQFIPDFGLTGNIKAFGDRQDEIYYEIICCDGIPYVKTNDEKKVIVGENESVLDILSSINILDSDVRIILNSKNIDKIIGYKHWNREYRGNRIIFDGCYENIDLIFMFIEDDFQKHCIQNKSIIFENMFRFQVKVLDEESFNKCDVNLNMNISIKLSLSTIMDEHNCNEYIKENIHKALKVDSSFFENFGEINSIEIANA